MYLVHHLIRAVLVNLKKNLQAGHLYMDFILETASNYIEELPILQKGWVFLTFFLLLI